MQSSVPYTNHSVKVAHWVNIYQTSSGRVGFYIEYNIDGPLCVRIADLNLLLRYSCNGIRLEEKQDLSLSQKRVVDHNQTIARRSWIKRAKGAFAKLIAGKTNPSTKTIEAVVALPTTVSRWVRLEGGWPLSYDPEVIKAVLFQLENEQKHFKFSGKAKIEDLTEGLPDDILAIFPRGFPAVGIFL
ncbi:MAG: hypothetical protein ACHQUC_04010 [Chlamydiales bacterium]